MAEKTWMETWTGRRFDLLDPDPAQVDIRDIARHLAILNRFTGATRCPYSVAQHSLYVSMLLPESLQLHGLLHDAGEAYYGDLSTPLKAALYRFDSNWEMDLAQVDWAISLALNLKPLSEDEEWDIKRADMQAMADEKAFLKPNSTSDWSEYDLPPPAGRLDMRSVMTWKEAEQAFLDRYYRLATLRRNS